MKFWRKIPSAIWEKSKAIAEFSAAIEGNIFASINKYTEEVKAEFSPSDIKDFVIDFLDEAISINELLLNLVELDSHKHEESLLYRITQSLIEILLPSGNKLDEIYSKLIDQSVEWYEAQRYILRPTTYYKDEIGKWKFRGYLLRPTRL